MLKPRKIAYRVCPACSQPIPLTEDHCGHCGHAFGSRVAEIEADHILRGKVFYNGRWVTIDEKKKAEQFVQEQLTHGMVEHNGQWITIDEKVRLIQSDSTSASEKLVEFPVKPIQRAENTQTVKDREEILDEIDSSIIHGSVQKKKSHIVIIVLSLLTFLTMVGAIFGILLSKGFLVH